MNSFVTISVSGPNPKLFLKRLLFYNISFSKCKVINKNKIILDILYNDFLKLKEKNHVYEVQIVKEHGLYRYIHFIKKNIYFFIGILSSILLLFIISNIIFDIEIVHNDKEIRTLVRNELEKNGIDVLKIATSYETRSKIIEKIMEENKNYIEWMEIERKGSKYIVKVTEKKKNELEENGVNGHIVAKKDGIIKKIIAEDGEIIKKKNDYVRKGDIIISGDIIKDDVVKGQVSAKGKIYAETWYNVRVSLPLTYEETRYLDKTKNNIVTYLFGKRYYLFKNYNSSVEEKKMLLLGEKIFPFQIYFQKQRKTETIRRKFTESEAIKEAESLADKKIQSSLDTDEYIISKKTLNFNIKDSKIELVIFFKVYEDITDFAETDKKINDNINQTT